MQRPTHFRWTFLAICMLALGALSFSAPTTVLAQDELKDLTSEYEQQHRDGQRTAMGRTAERIGNLNTKEAAEFLVEELEKDQKERRRGKPGLPGEVRDKIITGLGKFTNADAVTLIGEMALGMKSAKEPTLALDQFDFFKALAGMKEVPAADETLRKALADEDNPYIKCAALEAIRQQEATRFTGDVTKILLEENEAWSKEWLIVPINVFTCLEDIVDSDDKPAVISVVEAVITWEERKWCLDERVRYYGGRMLAEITGETADMGSVFFWKWWVQQMKAVGAVDTSNKPAEKRSKTAAIPPVFDTAPVGKRFVFVIDTSDSMKLPLKIDLGEIEKRRERRGPVSGKRKNDKGEEGEEEEEDNNPLRQLPWKDIDTKMKLAREELARAIRSFEGDRYFAVVIYSTEVEVITDGYVHATPGNCKKWADKALELEPDSLTNIHGGLKQAMQISDKGTEAKEPAVDKNCVLSGADTIIFLTDGWASWSDNSTAQDRQDPRNPAGMVGNGDFILGEDIWPDIVRMNLFRKVIINTVGIGNHDGDLMKNLAKRTGGVYVDWGFPE